MALSDYRGQTPRGETEAVIDRVTAHRVWDVGSDPAETCDNCETNLPLDERHLLVTLREAGRARQVYLCDERCVAEWVDR
jgi:hypothetical protein